MSSWIRISPAELAALHRLLAVAGNRSTQGRRVADFLLAWWNAARCGGYDLMSAQGLDGVVAEDIWIVFGTATRTGVHPDDLGYGPRFEALARQWHPEIFGYGPAEKVVRTR